MKKKKFIIRLLIALLCAIIFALLVPYVYGEKFTHCRWGMAFLFWMFCSAIAISVCFDTIQAYNCCRTLARMK